MQQQDDQKALEDLAKFLVELAIRLKSEDERKSA